MSVGSSMVFCLSVVIVTSAHAATVAEWRSDLGQVVADIRTVHPNPFTKLGDRAFNAEVNALDRDIPGLTEQQRMVRVMQLVASLGDGHTQLEPSRPDFAAWYPFRIHNFSDGYFITTVHKSIQGLEGAQVLRIGGRSVDDAADRARTLRGSDNAMGAKINLYALHNAALMRGLGLAESDGALAMTVRLQDGSLQNVKIRPLPANDNDSTFEWAGASEEKGPFIGKRSDWIAAYRHLPVNAFATTDTSRAIHFQNRTIYHAMPLPQFKAYYIQVIWMHDAEGEGFVPFFKRALSEVDAQKPRDLIIDLRLDLGGDGSFSTDVIEEFIKRANNPPWSNLYVLTGPKCFSACIIALADFKRFTNASIVGEPTGAGWNAFGDADVGSFDFPKTGMHMFVSALWHQLADSNYPSPFTPVDAPAPFSFADYVAGKDPAVDAILSGIDMRSIVEIARTEGAAAARVAFERRKVQFGLLPWWEPANKDDLNALGNDLRRAGKAAEAVDVLKLNAEMFPSWWNSWDSLGEALLVAGNKREGLEDYRHALALNPGDYDAQQALKHGG